MVRESLWHHFSSPQFWAPTGHVLSHYLPVVQFEKIGMEAVQTAWLLQLALLTARRRKHNLTIYIYIYIYIYLYIYSHVVCRRWYGKGCCGRCCCSPCARDGWPYSCFESWKAGLETPAAANQSRSQGPGWFNFILVCHVCVGEAVLTFHRATCTFIFPISGFFLVKLHCTCIAPLVLSIFLFQLCARRKNDAESWNRRANWAPKTSRGSWPSKWPVSSSSFFKTICLTEALVTAVSRGVSSSFLKSICFTEALETAVSKGVRQECGEVTRGRLPNDCCLPRHQKHVFACFGTCFCCGPKKLLRILPTIFADFILARQSHSSCTHEKLLTREIEITMAWTQNY